ncbi:tRNA lysidine(34) synthetase TilS [Roseicella frigidaeris]|uniref:tRNA(Ile)-lysidine synthase n=1 Tax=Roseicella frigidaeris TaxID=2230885 RepID=A0A327LXD4_9PROT|nr:tRNA lysidine(34) synthetase TilS [Roseicella frigidaeris]RAI55270.1 tRNA lysidine(34) synthetase TilS [Roseicella frigidaeris]
MAAADLPLGPAEFAGLMAPLGPFGASPRLAAGVSGGPHSLALALLAADWARARGGSLLALIVDHGLRPGSAAEAAGVAAQLAGRGIAARILGLGLAAGPGLQARAREARHAALLRACGEVGRPWLLLGHHRGDQAETLLLRAFRGSGAAGLAAMAAVRAAPEALLLRPLLAIPPARLEAVVRAAGLAPVRDPSNADARFGRVALRAALADPAGTGAAVEALAAAAAGFAARRGRGEGALAARLAEAVRLHPTGHATIDPARLGEDALADAGLGALVRLVGGGAFPPAPAAVAALRRRGGGTLGGAILRRSRGGGRGGWLLARESAAVAPPVAAVPGAGWDGRFRLLAVGRPGCSLGALGADAAGLRRAAPGLPALVLATLPAIRQHGALVAVPCLSYPDAECCAEFPMLLAPTAGPVTGGAEWRGRVAH